MTKILIEKRIIKHVQQKIKQPDVSENTVEEFLINAVEKFIQNHP